MHLLCLDIFLKNEITPEYMPREKRKHPFSSEKDYPNLLPADAGELCSAALCAALL